MVPVAVATVLAFSMRRLRSRVAVFEPGGERRRRCSTPGPDAVKVVTTTTVFADIVQNVGGSRVAASSIIPPGVGPEDYEPKPDDAKKLADADLIVSNGVGLDDFLNDLLASGSGGDTPHRAR